MLRFFWAWDWLPLQVSLSSLIRRRTCVAPSKSARPPPIQAGTRWTLLRLDPANYRIRVAALASAREDSTKSPVSRPLFYLAVSGGRDIHVNRIKKLLACVSRICMTQHFLITFEEKNKGFTFSGFPPRKSNFLESVSSITLIFGKTYKFTCNVWCVICDNTDLIFCKILSLWVKGRPKMLQNGSLRAF